MLNYLNEMKMKIRLISAFGIMRRHKTFLKECDVSPTKFHCCMTCDSACDNFFNFNCISLKRRREKPTFKIR